MNRFDFGAESKVWVWGPTAGLVPAQRAERHLALHAGDAADDGRGLDATLDSRVGPGDEAGPGYSLILPPQGFLRRKRRMRKKRWRTAPRLPVVD